MDFGVWVRRIERCLRTMGASRMGFDLAVWQQLAKPRSSVNSGLRLLQMQTLEFGQFFEVVQAGVGDWSVVEA